MLNTLNAFEEILRAFRLDEVDFNDSFEMSLAKFANAKSLANLSRTVDKERLAGIEVVKLIKNAVYLSCKDIIKLLFEEVLYHCFVIFSNEKNVFLSEI